MGANCCTTSDERNAHATITQHMDKDEKEDKHLHRILLLGPGDSGKTTLLKQMRKINNREIPKESLLQYTPHIRQSVMSDIRKLLAQTQWTQKLGINLNLSDYDINLQNNNNNNNDNENKTNDNNKKYSHIIETIENFLEVTDDVGDTIDDDVIDDNYIKIMKDIWQFWKDHNLSILPINNSSPYFLDKIDKVFSKNFIPTFEDYLRHRVRTPGFVKETFSKKYTQSKVIQKFEIIDVGGQRSERHKWLNRFENTVQCVLYVASIGDYDKTIWEDDSVKRLEEALSLFDTVIEKGFFKGKEIIIFLNKFDLFKEKMKVVDLSKGFENFDDFPKDQSSKDWEDGLAYIQSRFTNVYKNRNNQSEQGISFHPTCALDTDLVDKLFTEIQFSLVNKQLESVGVVKAI